MKFLSIITILLTGFMSAQIQKVDSLKLIQKPYERDDELYARYIRVKYQFDSLKLHNNSIERAEIKRENVKQAYSKLLSLDNFNSLKIQNALLNDYFLKYKEKPLTHKFNNRAEVEKRIGLIDEAYVSSIALMYLNVIMKHLEQSVQTMNDYIDTNLKRLNLTRKEFEELSDNDKEIIWKEFK